LGDYEGRRWYMPLLCRDRMRDAIANQLINKLSRSIKSIHLMEVIFGILIPSVTWIELNGFCILFDNSIHFADNIVGHHLFAVHKIWGYWLEEEHSRSFVSIFSFDNCWCCCFCVFMFVSFSFAMFIEDLGWESSKHGHANMFCFVWFWFGLFFFNLVFYLFYCPFFTVWFSSSLFGSINEVQASYANRAEMILLLHWKQWWYRWILQYLVILNGFVDSIDVVGWDRGGRGEGALMKVTQISFGKCCRRHNINFYAKGECNLGEGALMKVLKSL
jgi:hypothetical protein